MGDGAGVTDEQFGIMMVNHTAGVHLNIREQEVLGQHLLTFLRGFESNIDLRELRGSTDRIIQFDLERRTGTYAAMHAAITRIFNSDGTVAAQMAVFRDVTAKPGGTVEKELHHRHVA